MKNENITKYRDEFISVGLKIGYLRRQRGMTQEQLAEKAGISLGFLSQIEAPNLSVGISLAADTGSPCFRLFTKKVKSKFSTHTKGVKKHTFQLHITLDCSQML